MASLPDLSSPMEASESEEPRVPVMEDQMDDSELVAILRQHETQAIGYTPGSDDEISTQQERALNYYYGIMDDVPAEDGTSSVVDRTVQVVVDNALAALLKPFLSSDETVRFSPRGPEDVEVAEQATEYVNYVLNCDNCGPLIFHNWFKDALLTKLGVVKVWWEEETRVDNQRQAYAPDEMSAAFMRAQPDYLGEDDGAMYFGNVVKDGRIKVENVPPEEFRISPLARDLGTAIYTAHVPLNVTRSDLIEMGFDPEIVESLPAITGSSIDNTIRIARYHDERIGDEAVSAPHSSQERVALRDEYIRVDYNGDGIAELRRIVRVEDTVLLNEEIEAVPFAALCPVPMPHKVIGLSLADLAIEDQKIATVLMRQTLDNLYKSNNPRPVIGDSAWRDDGATEDSLNDNAPGAGIFVKDLAGFRYDAVPFVADKSFPMIEFVASKTEEKTGVSKAGQGLDANAIKKSGQMTATEIAQIASGKNARIEMVARLFAETGVKQLFKLVLKLLSTNQPRERMIRMRNQWVPINPNGWPDMDLEVSVGLGIGEKTEQIAQADSVLQTMAELLQTPFASLIDETKAYNAVKRKFTAAGIKNTDDFLVEPKEGQAQPKQPSPEEMKAQAEMQMQAAKLQSEQQLAELKLQMQAQEAQQKMDLERQKAEFEAQQAEAKMAFEMRMAEMKFDFEQRLAARRQVASEQQAEAKLSTNREGGDLDK